jgi:hypothetical protein
LELWFVFAGLWWWGWLGSTASVKVIDSVVVMWTGGGDWHKAMVMVVLFPWWWWLGAQINYEIDWIDCRQQLVDWICRGLFVVLLQGHGFGIRLGREGVI